MNSPKQVRTDYIQGIIFEQDPWEFSYTATSTPARLLGRLKQVVKTMHVPAEARPLPKVKPLSERQRQTRQRQLQELRDRFRDFK